MVAMISGYRSDEELRELVVPFVDAGLRSGETVVVLVTPGAARVLRRALGEMAARVWWQLAGHDAAWLGRSFAAYEGLTGTRLVVEFDGPPVLKRLAAFRRFDGPWLRLYDARRFPSQVDSGFSSVPRDAVTAEDVAEVACALGVAAGERESVARATESLTGKALVWRDGDLVFVRADRVGDDAWRFADTVVRQGDSVELTFPAAAEMSVAAAGFEQGAALQFVYEGEEFIAVAMNAAAREVLGPAPLGRPARDWVGQFGESGQLVEIFREVFTTGVPFAGREWRMGTGENDVRVNFDVTPWRAADGEILGVLTTASIVTDLVRAREAAQARYEYTRDVVGQLQQALLPVDLPVLPGVRIAARYLIAGDEVDAGGDWFDAMPLEGGRVALVVGDVVGHGVTASAAMGQLRTVLRERLHAGAGLAEAMAALDRFAAGVPEAHAATVCVVVLDPVSGQCEYCTAGHPAPLLVSRDGGTRYLEASGAGPLATGVPMTVSHESVSLDALLVLYSDGILERPGRAPARSTVELAQLVGEVRAGTVRRPDTEAVVERVCEVPLEMLTRTGRSDDISLLAVHRVELPRELDLSVPARNSAVGVVRRELVTWLTEVHAGEDDRFALTHAMSELVTNSVEHAYAGDEPDPVVQVRVRLLAGGDALVVVGDRGRWRRSRQEPDRGRGHGLAMAADLADELELDRRPDGTTATLRRSLRRPARLLSADAGAPVVPAESAFTMDRKAGTVIVAGPVDVDTAPALRDELLRTTRGGTHGVTVDLSAVDHLSSAAVRVLHEAARRAGMQGERLRLVAPAGSTAQQVLTLVGLDGLLRLRGFGRR